MNSKKREVKNILKSPIKKEIKKLEADKDIAFDFASLVYTKFKEVIKAIAMFGSAMKNKATPSSDIDIVIIIDDCTINWDDELISWYREELSKLLAAQNYKKEIHVNTVTLTAFWEELRTGEPLVINVLRYGEALIDVGGFFDPLRVLLAKGKIRPSPEAIFMTVQRAGQHLTNANDHILKTVEGFYWAMVDSAHAALMAMNVIPPSPEEVAFYLNNVFVKERKLKSFYLDYYEEVRKKAKSIIHYETNRVSGKDLEDLQNKAEEFVVELNKITRSLIENEKIIKYELKKD